MALFECQIDQILMVFPLQHGVQYGRNMFLIPLPAVYITLGNQGRRFAHQPPQPFTFSSPFSRAQLQFKQSGIKGTLLFNGVGHLPDDVCKSLALCGRAPGQVQPLPADTCQFQEFLGELDLLFCLDITILVMAIADVSPRDQDPVPPLF